jgi:hypothetical protein
MRFGVTVSSSVVPHAAPVFKTKPTLPTAAADAAASAAPCTKPSSESKTSKKNTFEEK